MFHILASCGFCLGFLRLDLYFMQGIVLAILACGISLKYASMTIKTGKDQWSETSLQEDVGLADIVSCDHTKIRAWIFLHQRR